MLGWNGLEGVRGGGGEKTEAVRSEGGSDEGHERGASNGLVFLCAGVPDLQKEVKWINPSNTSL